MFLVRENPMATHAMAWPCRKNCKCPGTLAGATPTKVTHEGGTQPKGVL